MSGWERIGENDALPTPEVVVGFDGPTGVYRVHVKPAPPHGIEVVPTRFRERWHIERAEARDGVLRLSGTAFPAPGILDNTAWFALTLGDTPVMEYWGDRVLLRRDGHTG